VSGETGAPASPALGLGRIAKPRAPVDGSSRAHALHARQRGRLGRQAREEALERALLRLGLDHHPARVVEDVAADVELGRQPVDVGAEADALDGALDAHADPAPAEQLGHPGSSTSSRRRW
jgi:hypothetical protein